jgi:universal stress protein A
VSHRSTLRVGRRDDSDATASDGAYLRLREFSMAIPANRVWLEVRVGRPAEQISRIATEYNAELVVIGKHGERQGPWKLLGSTAESVLRTSKTDVVIVNGPRDETPRRILAAVDDSEITPAVLDTAGYLATEWACDVTALQVVSAAVMSHVLSMASIAAPGAVEPTPSFVREEFAEDISRWESELRASGLLPDHAHAEVAFGGAAQEIVAAAERLGSDLIVMGETGSGRLPRLLLGSTLRDVMRHASCPVLVVSRR